MCKAKEELQAQLLLAVPCKWLFPRSQIWLIRSYKGQEYSFVYQLEDYLRELECPICCGIVSEPVLTSCGRLFCRECYNKLESGRRRLGAGIRMLNNATCPVCPVCPTIMQDMFTDRRVKNLKVRCINHKEGCD